MQNQAKRQELFIDSGKQKAIQYRQQFNNNGWIVRILLECS